MGLLRKVQGKFMKRESISKTWRKKQIISLDELAEKEAGIEVFFSDIEQRIEEKRKREKAQIDLSISQENKKKQESMFAEYN